MRKSVVHQEVGRGLLEQSIGRHGERRGITADDPYHDEYSTSIVIAIHIYTSMRDIEIRNMINMYEHIASIHTSRVGFK